VIDTAQAAIVDHLPLHEIAGVFHLALSADGRLGVAAELHPKNLMPLAHLEHGGAFVDTITLFGADVGKPVEIPLDDVGALRLACPSAWPLRRTNPASTSPAPARKFVTVCRCAAAAQLHHIMRNPLLWISLSAPTM